jgi:hypothetical protein
VGAPQTHRLSGIPRPVTWDEARRMLAHVDRRTVVGRRDYAMLLPSWTMSSTGGRRRPIAICSFALRAVACGDDEEAV